MRFPRSSGILLHPSSLPSSGGIGDLGPAAYEFADFLAAAGQSLWQVLPLAPTGAGNSPYSTTSAFAGNPLLISLERLAERGWLPREGLPQLPAGTQVDFSAVRAVKLPLLRQAAQNFISRASEGARARYENFCREQGEWLEDFVLFDLLHQKFNHERWNRWPAEIARREPETLHRLRQELGPEMPLGRAVQFFFFEQWKALRLACRARGLRVMGDIAIFVSFDSADVWTYPGLFQLRPDGQPEFVAGVPPDAFSSTGQRWGNPLYRWEVLRQTGYGWWIARMRAALGLCDIVRLDHFRGFEKYWAIPSSEPTAVNGRWMPGPSDELFHALRNALGELPLVAEDLGYITPEVHALRQRLGIPGMRVMQFGFGDSGDNPYLPHRYGPEVVAYTGTHDNDTVLGWWRTASQTERANAAAYLGIRDESEVAWAFIRAAEASLAGLCIIPLQDVLGLGSEARMNIPSRSEGNWRWRCAPGQLTPALAARLRQEVELTDRRPAWGAGPSQSELSQEFAA